MGHLRKHSQREAEVEVDEAEQPPISRSVEKPALDVEEAARKRHLYQR